METRWTWCVAGRTTVEVMMGFMNNRSMRPSFWKWGLLLVGLFFLIDGFIPKSRLAVYDPWAGVSIASLMFLLFSFSCMVRLK